MIIVLNDCMFGYLTLSNTAMSQNSSYHTK